MRKDEAQSKEGLYDIYYTAEGKKLIVLEGLNPQDQFNQPPLQQKIHDHYAFFSTFYWALLVSILIFLVAVHIMKPLIKKYRKR